MEGDQYFVVCAFKECHLKSQSKQNIVHPPTAKLNQFEFGNFETNLNVFFI